MDGSWMLRERHVYRPACGSDIHRLVFRFSIRQANQDKPPGGDIVLPLKLHSLVT